MSPPESWSFGPLAASSFQDPDRVAVDLRWIADTSVADDLLQTLWIGLHEHLPAVDDADAVVTRLRDFISVSRSPTSLLALFERDQQSLPALLQILATGPNIAARLLSEPECFDMIRASDGRASSREVLVDELVGEIRTIATPRRASQTIHQFVCREVLRIAYGEFVRGMSPEKAQQQLSHVADAVVQAALEFVIADHASRSGLPQRADGKPPRWSVVAMGSWGGCEIGYDAPLDMLLICDQIDRKNSSHVEFNRQLASDLIQLCGDQGEGPVLPPLRFGHQPGHDDHHGADGPPIDFFSVDEAVEHYERTSRTWQRLAFVKARPAAGNEAIAQTFLNRLQPWVYHHLLSRSEIADVRVLRRKLEKRSGSDIHSPQIPIANVPGGRRDIELTIQFLQLLHGSELPDVRRNGTLEAIAALGRSGCLTHQEASLLAENHARLCRLEHHLTVLRHDDPSPGIDVHLPADHRMRERLAWRLGVRKTDSSKGDNGGDGLRFSELLDETLEVNRRIINHLMVDDETADSDPENSGATISFTDETSAVAVETELILDPDPDPELFRQTLQARNFSDADAAIDRVLALSQETVTFLSPRRCRHFFAAVAPALLQQIGQTPNPDHTLAKLVEVTDSIGAKATLWELLRTNRATLTLTVKMCGLAPYLTEILIQHPGMIDELIDSLVMDRLPSADRLDAQSIRMCDGLESIGPALRNFKASAHLMVGVRDLLDKEPIDSIGRALSDTSESCIRRVIERQHELLASRFGDPMDDKDNPVEMVTLALGKFGGRETNYHSDLELAMIYTAEGQTRRRIGGPRTTLSNRQFFHQLAQAVIRELTVGSGGRLAGIDLPLSAGAEKELLTVSLPMFVKPFRQATASVWHRLSLCKARPVSGSKATRTIVADSITRAMRQTPFRPSLLGEIVKLRHNSESTAGPNNLKRGPGGTVDIEFIATAGQLQAMNDPDYTIRPGTIESLQDLAIAGIYNEDDTRKLIDNYRVLRRIEAKLRLVNTVARHELPLDRNDSIDTLPMHQLTTLLGETDPAALVQQCETIRAVNRSLFQKMIG